MMTNQGYCHPCPPGIENQLDAGKRRVVDGNYEDFIPSAGSIVVLQVAEVDPFSAN
jgi:hypothetical protein